MSDLNDVKLFGRIVKDATIQLSNNDKKKALFTLAVNRTKKDENGNYYKEANFFSISAFVTDKLAAYLTKGQPLIIEGELVQKTKEYTDETGKRLFDSKIYIATKKLRPIFVAKKESQPNNAIENIPEFTEEPIYETENTSEDIYMDESPSFF